MTSASVSPLPRALAAEAAEATYFIRSTWSPNPDNVTAMTRDTDGKAIASSAVTVPDSEIFERLLSLRGIRVSKSQGALDQIKQDGPDLFTSHDHD